MVQPPSAFTILSSLRISRAESIAFALSPRGDEHGGPYGHGESRHVASVHLIEQTIMRQCNSATNGILAVKSIPPGQEEEPGLRPAHSGWEKYGVASSQACHDRIGPCTNLPRMVMARMRAAPTRLAHSRLATAVRLPSWLAQSIALNLRLVGVSSTAQADDVHPATMMD
jgi:hypothetical protein